MNRMDHGMNQTDVRTFKAATMQEALDVVRRELGPDAVILQTRELPQSRFLSWRKNSERVEVTAGAGVNVRPPRGLMSSGERTALADSVEPARPAGAYRPAGPVQ